MLVKRTIEQSLKGQGANNLDYAKNAVSETITKYLLQKTAKRPLVIPVILSI
jgi:mRNA degradation ribonuclease J1/J2